MVLPRWHLSATVPIMRKGRYHIDLTGQRFNRWTVLAFNGVLSNGHAQFLCRCDCGTERVVTAARLKNGNSKSCGCLRREKTAEACTTHGLSKHRLFPTWNAMMHRCYSPASPAFPRYGGRGIFVTERWHDVRAFIKDLEPSYRERMSLDRIDNNGPYSPENVRWASAETQSRNTRRNRMLTHEGRTMTLFEWAYELGLKPGTLWKRIASGWSIEDALTRPPNGRP